MCAQRKFGLFDVWVVRHSFQLHFDCPLTSTRPASSVMLFHIPARLVLAARRPSQFATRLVLALSRCRVRDLLWHPHSTSITLSLRPTRSTSVLLTVSLRNLSHSFSIFHSFFLLSLAFECRSCLHFDCLLTPKLFCFPLSRLIRRNFKFLSNHPRLTCFCIRPFTLGKQNAKLRPFFGFYVVPLSSSSFRFLCLLSIDFGYTQICHFERRFRLISSLVFG